MKRIQYGIVILLLCMGMAPGCTRHQTPVTPKPPPEPESIEPTAIHSEVLVFILPTCPHCAELVRTLLSLRREMDNAMQITFLYVGSLTEDGLPAVEDNSPDVKAATLQICAGIHSDSHGQWLDFMDCAYRDDSWQHMETALDRCATEASLDATEIRDCIQSGEGADQLAMSMAISIANGIDRAPVMFVDETPYTGQRDRAALLQYMCHLTGNADTRPAICADIPAPAPVSVTLLTDARCVEQEDCQVDREIAAMETLFPSMKLTVLDYAQTDGRDLYDRVVQAKGPETLPYFLISDSLANHGSAVAVLEDFLVRFEDGYLLPLGSRFNPTREICDNRTDDTGNGLVDCDDPQCDGTLPCRSKRENRLDLFIMTHCPFASMMMPLVDHFLTHLKTAKTPVEFRFQFIGREEDGKLISMHGEPEVTENIRLACIQQLYPRDHAFLSYALCRARDIHAEDWESCLSGSMKRKAVDNCVDGKQGRDLLVNSFSAAGKIGIQASPTFLLNNHLSMRARTADQILRAFCEANPSSACDVEMAPLLIETAPIPAQQCESSP
jgi:predicted DsbA family dithiol-disulfide isomerase